MTTKEYVQKFNLEKTNKVNQDDFIADFTNELMSLLEVGKGTQNIKGFENAERAIKMKWDAVSGKVAGGLPRELWFYFSREVIERMKAGLFPKEIAKREAQAKEDMIRRERWKQREKEQNARFERSFGGGGFGGGFGDFDFIGAAFLFAILRKGARNNALYGVLGLPETATAEDVKKKYKELALVHHPDRGGKYEDFIRITEAKNKLLAFLE